MYIQFNTFGLQELQCSPETLSLTFQVDTVKLWHH